MCRCARPSPCGESLSGLELGEKASAIRIQGGAGLKEVSLRALARDMGRGGRGGAQPFDPGCKVAPSRPPRPLAVVWYTVPPRERPVWVIVSSFGFNELEPDLLLLLSGGNVCVRPPGFPLQEAAPETTGSHVAGEERKEKVPSPHLSQLVVLTASGTLYGLAERVVATESFMLILGQDVNPGAICNKVILEVGIEFEQFNKRLGDVSRQVRIPLPVSNVLWEHCIRLANRTLVEGYANVKKCSNEGRALMQLDFQQFLMKLEKLTDIRPIPDKEFVETYIKAYYLTENDMEQFIKNHREYSTKQLTNLHPGGALVLSDRGVAAGRDECRDESAGETGSDPDRRCKSCESWRHPRTPPVF
ncbi:UNVERIFIED_CONTAM: hypothetical protein FKN15_026981 [Acipenser sinensis]